MRSPKPGPWLRLEHGSRLGVVRQWKRFDRLRKRERDAQVGNDCAPPVVLDRQSERTRGRVNKIVERIARHCASVPAKWQAAWRSPGKLRSTGISVLQRSTPH